MPKLTAQILRDAADKLISGTDGYNDGLNRFMCTAVTRAMCGVAGPCQSEFIDLLHYHRVPTDGTLGRGPLIEDSDHIQQAIRFDFLNLLAESFDDAR